MNTNTTQNEVQISARLQREAKAVSLKAPALLERRGLQAAFSDWLLTQDRGLTWLFGVLDVTQVERLERYTQQALLHHLSTDLGGVPVYLSNSSGLRFAFLLSGKPSLPRKVAFPGVERGYALIGEGLTGTVGVRWERLLHLLVAGMSGSGKSTFLRALVYQALAEGFSLGLGDLDGVTFPMLEEHPQLLTQIAHTPEEMLALVQRALGECDHRDALYRQTPGFPEKLEEYNAIAGREGLEVLPRVLIVLDEYNSAVLASGGAKGPLGEAAALLGRDLVYHGYRDDR